MGAEYPRFKGDNPFASQAKMLLHLDRVNEWQMTGDCSPIFMEINLTSKCNLACEWCISENFRSSDTIDAEKLLSVLDEFASMGGQAVTFSGGGEPTMHPAFEMLADRARIPLQLGLMTNGVYEDDYNSIISDDFQWVRFSLDTVDGKKYKKWKGRDEVKTVLKNIRLLHEGRSDKLRIGVNCNVNMEHTPKDIRELIWTVEDQCDYIQFRPVLPRYFKGETIQMNEKVWAYLSKINHPKINLSDDKVRDLHSKTLFPFRECMGHFFSPIINANGDVSVCMYHPDDKRFVFGNIYEKSFVEIWASKRRFEVIRDLKKIDYAKECQVCCKLTELNRFLDFVSHPDEMRDVNFL